MNGDGSQPLVVPFNRPTTASRQVEYVERALRNGRISGDGSFTVACQELLEREVGLGRALLTTSCTHALEMCASLLNVEPGDEVIIPSYTFVSTANAFALRGARPVFADVHPDTLTLDPDHVRALVGPRTLAIVPVHYAGVASGMDELLIIGRSCGAAIVEDNAHGLFGTYRGQPLGTLGVMATLSFHDTKNLTCGEGGALIINDPALVQRAEIIREKGTDRSRFFRGEVDKYTWVDIGSSYLPSDILAAVLLAQFEERERIQAARKRLWEAYAGALETWADEQGMRLPTVPQDVVQAFHMFHLRTPDPATRTGLIHHLKERGVLAVFHYQPLHLSPMGRQFGGRRGDCPVTEAVADRVVRLPFYTDMTDDELHLVLDAVTSFRGSCGG